MKIAFLGDISFNDDYTGLYEKGLNPFAAISQTLSDCDFVIGNLECISEGNDGENELKKPRLKTNIQTLNYLKNINISAVTLAHNHIFDNLKDGYVKTIDFLDSNKIHHLGAGLSGEEAESPLLIENKGLKVCIMSYVHPDTNPNLPDNCTIKLNIYSRENIIREVQKYREKNFFIVLVFHWGGRFEGGKYPDRYQMKDARIFMESGAGLIVGHHSHTLQPYERLGNKFVFYSLGNFCFSDILFEGERKKMTSQLFSESVIPIITLKEDHCYDIRICPVKNKKLFIIKQNSVLRKLRFRNLIFKTLRIIPGTWNMYKIYFQVISPVLKQFFRKDSKKTLLQRIFSFNFSKLKTLLNK